MAAKKRPLRKKTSTRRERPLTMAERADRHDCYQRSVQAVDAEIDFVDETFTKLRKRKAVTLREDFCGTGNTSCEWVRRRRTNRAIGVDLCVDTMAWGIEHNVDKLPEEAQRRVRLHEGNVLTAKIDPVDIVLAMNFSYFLLTDRKTLLSYFKHVRNGLQRDGLFMLDCYGGWESYKPCREPRKINKNLTYIWDQADFDPISGMATCHIHFKFSDGSKLNKAFSYHWRMWTLPEVRELLAEAGFKKSTVYWEGEDAKTGEGDGHFQPADKVENEPAWICYIVAEK